MPEVDAFIGLDQITQVAPIITNLFTPEEQRERNLVTERPRYIPDYDTPRFRLTPRHYAYIKLRKGATTPARSALFPKFADNTAAARRNPSCAKLNSWCAPA